LKKHFERLCFCGSHTAAHAWLLKPKPLLFSYPSRKSALSAGIKHLPHG
jgi:hypothetical protein